MVGYLPLERKKSFYGGFCTNIIREKLHWFSDVSIFSPKGLTFSMDCRLQLLFVTKAGQTFPPFFIEGFSISMVSEVHAILVSHYISGRSQCILKQNGLEIADPKEVHFQKGEIEEIVHVDWSFQNMLTEVQLGDLKQNRWIMNTLTFHCCSIGRTITRQP